MADEQLNTGTQEAQPSANTQQSQNDTINLLDPQGQLVGVPAEQHQQALNEGYSHPTPQHIEAYKRHLAASTPGQQALTALEGAGQAATFGLSTAAETGLGLATPEEIQTRQEENPGAHALGQAAGLITSSLTGQGEGALLESAGKAAAKAAGLGAPVTTAAKIGSAAVKFAVDNALFQSGDEVSKMFSQDPSQSVETAVTDIGLFGLIGGGFGAGIGAISPLWKATLGTKMGGILKAVTEHAGGIEGATEDPVAKMAQEAGVDLEPVIKAGMSQEPTTRQMAQTLNDSATQSGLIAQEARRNFHAQAGNAVSDTFGRTVDSIPEKSDISNYEHGRNIANVLADEADEKIGPEVKEYEAYKSRYKDVPFSPSVTDKSEELLSKQQKLANDLGKATKEAIKAQQEGSVEKSLEAAAKVDELRNQIKSLQTLAKAPGTTDTLIEKISNLAEKEKWNISPSSDEMRAVGQVLKELPGLKNLDDLTAYIKRVGSNTASSLPFGQQTPLSRAGQRIIGVLRDAEADLIGRHVGSEEGGTALANYERTRANFAAKAKLVNSLNDRLNTGSSVSGFGKAVRAMGKEDGEKVLRKLSGKGDADLLNTLQAAYPRTAQALKDFHINSLLAGAKTAEGIDASRFLKAFESATQMSPELRNFIAGPGQQTRLDAIKSLIGALPEKVGKSGTPQGLDALMSNVPATAAGMISYLMGHGATGSVLVGSATKALGRNVPDAARLALLKFLGSSNHVDAGAFKTAVDFIHATIKGENLTSKAAKAVFTAGKEVLPAALMPTDEDREKLDKHLSKVQANPQVLMTAGTQTAHYLPEHAQALSATAANACNYLNSIRPSNAKAAPLDSKPVTSSAVSAAYNRQLNIAQQPLVVLDSVKKGTLTPQDVNTFKTLYPALYERVRTKLTGELVSEVDKGHMIPYRTRFGLSMLLAQPLDSTMTPAGIMAAQPMPAQAPQQPQQAPKKSTAALNKLAKGYQTPGQAAEEHSAKKD